MIRKLYPYGKKKAFNVTYDDGVLQDVRFVELLNKYNLKGTFNLNSGLMEKEFEWTHECGLVIKRLKKDVVVDLYKGHEVASHTLNHPYMENLSKEDIMNELSLDKANLEKIFGREIKGFALPFHYYNDLIKSCVKECGFSYGRISEETGSFRLPDDYFSWKATFFHHFDKLESLTREFIETNEELGLFQIAGHSYDLDVADRWDIMEDVFKVIGEQEDILPMTTIEIVEYCKAMEKAEITNEYIKNDSDESLWFEIDGSVCEVKAGEVLKILS